MQSKRILSGSIFTKLFNIETIVSKNMNSKKIHFMCIYVIFFFLQKYWNLFFVVFFFCFFFVLFFGWLGGFWMNDWFCLRIPVLFIFSLDEFYQLNFTTKCSRRSLRSLKGHSSRCQFYLLSVPMRPFCLIHSEAPPQGRTELLHLTGIREALLWMRIWWYVVYQTGIM